MLISQNETVIEQTEMEVAPRYKLLVHCLQWLRCLYYTAVKRDCTDWNDKVSAITASSVPKCYKKSDGSQDALII